MGSAIVICIGNALAGDDGAGQAVYEELSLQRLPETTRLKFLGLGGIDLLEELSGEQQLVVVDAVQLGSPPGTVHELAWDQLPLRELRPVSGHGIGVREAISIGRKLYPEKIPGSISLVGIEGKCFNQLGQGLSVEVDGAIPHAVSTVLKLLGEM
jgi:hydrogenase maturation protease